jgi:hypothetical protein
MTSDDRKKELGKAWRAQQRQTIVDSIPLPHADLNALFDYLDRDGCPPCDHSLRGTIQFLRERNLQMDPIVAWLREHGGYCDCEVLANVEETFGPLIDRE